MKNGGIIFWFEIWCHHFSSRFSSRLAILDCQSLYYKPIYTYFYNSFPYPPQILKRFKWTQNFSFLHHLVDLHLNWASTNNLNIGFTKFFDFWIHHFWFENWCHHFSSRFSSYLAVSAHLTSFYQLLNSVFNCLTQKKINACLVYMAFFLIMLEPAEIWTCL